ncbi:MAG: hypothetical protein HOI23_21430 [Deltaproteobacteria bacterium]|jgi:hypothetical protein|nr:hypothetical protein [Deltaproteobacteria bacterium]MBT6434748.1 hypothetical protein [Deltaproteobacteria bacterium]MBT6489954.1 hypothetical protein [Deltaproteobacteria bacterium]
MASRKRKQLEGGAVETVKSVHDVLEIVQTAMLAQVRRGGVPLGPNEIASVIRKLWAEAEIQEHGIGPAETYQEVQTRSIQNSKGDIQNIVEKLRVEAKAPVPSPASSPAAQENKSRGLELSGFAWILVAPFADLMSHDSELVAETLPWTMVPAWQAVMMMLCGEETIEKCRSKSEPLVAELEQANLSAMELKSRVESDPRAKKILAYLLSKLVMRFEKFERRREWMVRMLNDELEDIDIPTLKDTDEDWEFSEETFTLLFRRYAVDGKSNTQSPVMDRAYELIWKQHDAKGISVAAKFLKGLGAQRKSRS